MKKIFCILFFAIHFNGYAQTWSSVGSGVNDNAYNLCVFNGVLYVGGSFTNAGGLLCNKMASWNGTSWDTIPNVPGGDNLSALESFNGELYMGRGNPPFIHRWNNSNWDSVGTGLNSVVVDMIEFDSALYAGGLFTIAGDSSANHIAKWDGTNWSKVGTGLDKDVLSLAVYNNELYAGGRFDSAGAFNFTNHIAKWNGNNWVSLGAGITGGDVMAMCVYNGELYVGGDFTTAGGFAVPGIARWNGTTWNPVVSNLVGSFVGAIAVYNGELYVGGSFTSIGPINANNIARWDGINWSILGSGTDGVSGYVANLIVYNNELYASGLITEAGGIPVNNIAKWSNPTGINDFDIDFSLSAYPNPFRNEILVRGTNQNGELEIFDLTGKKIFTQCTVEKETNIMTSFLTPGFYLLKYSEPEKSVNLKLMKL